METPSRRALLYLRFREKAAEDGPEQLLRATRRGNNCLARRRYQHIRETDAELRSTMSRHRAANSAGYLRGMGRAFHQGPNSTGNLGTIRGAGQPAVDCLIRARINRGSDRVSS